MPCSFQKLFINDFLNLREKIKCTTFNDKRGCGISNRLMLTHNDKYNINN